MKGKQNKGQLKEQSFKPSCKFVSYMMQPRSGRTRFLPNASLGHGKPLIRFCTEREKGRGALEKLKNLKTKLGVEGKLQQTWQQDVQRYLQRLYTFNS